MKVNCRRTIAIVVVWAAISISSSAIAQVARNADFDDPVYEACDLIVAEGLVDDVIVGQRPYSRLEIARILKNASAALAERERAYDSKAQDWHRSSQELRRIDRLQKLIGQFEGEYARELRGMDSNVSVVPLRELNISLGYDSSLKRAIPPNNGQGDISGIITSFDRYRGRESSVDGINSTYGTAHDLYLGRYASLSVEPQFNIRFSDDEGDDVSATLHRLYAKSGWKNFELELGRDDIIWGQGDLGGLLFSANARPLDMVKLSNPYPWRAPSIFKYLGPMKFTFFASNLGPEREFPYSFLYGGKWSLKPHKNVELGISETIIIGGRNSPRVKWYDPIGELFPVHKWGRNINFGDASNHLFGLLDMRVQVPGLRGTAIYGETQFEDSFMRALGLPDNLMRQMSFVVGSYAPRLTSGGRLALRAEYHHTAPLIYRHSTWKTGYTLNGRSMGDPIGPAADGGYLTLYVRPSPGYNGRAGVAFEDFDSSTFATEPSPDGGGSRIFKDVAGIHERRYRLLAGFEWMRNKNWGADLEAGYERISNYNFAAGVSRNNGYAEVKLTLKFDN